MRLIALAIALMLVLALLQLLGCAAPVPAKPSIPDDLLLLCYKGQYAVCSRAAEECSLFKTECRPGAGVI